MCGTDDKTKLWATTVLLAILSVAFSEVTSSAPVLNPGNGFVPVTQCFRDTGAPGWVMKLANAGGGNTGNLDANGKLLVSPLTAATGVDPAGSGWLRLTTAGNGARGSAYYNLPINVSNLGIQAQFTYSTWGGNGADGIAFYLFDGTTSVSNYIQGNYGGALGYCQGAINGIGLSNAVIGIGIDEYGNFGNNTVCPYGGWNDGTSANRNIVMRGAGNGTNGYKWLADTYSDTAKRNLAMWYNTSTTVRPTDSQFYRNVIMNISPTVPGVTTSYTATTSWATTLGGAYTTLLSAPYPDGNTYPAVSNFGAGANLPFTPPSTWKPLPPTVKFGFSASTGGLNNFHEVRDAYITEGLPDLGITQNSASAAGGTGSFLVTVTNLGSKPATDATFTATTSGLANVAWSCTASGGSACPASGTGAPSSVKFSVGTVGNVSFTITGQVSAGATISDSVSIAGPTGFNDADLTSDTSVTSMNTSTTRTLNLSQMPQISDSASDNSIAGGQLKTSTQVYITKYSPINWTGTLQAYSLVTSGTTLAGAASTPNWDAGCMLTGGRCSSISTIPASTLPNPAPSSRKAFTWNDASVAGIPFSWGSLSPTETAALNSDPILASNTLGSTVVDFLLGVRTEEQSNPTNQATVGPFRTRSSVLGDIVESNPVWVGAPGQNYPSSMVWKDLLYPTMTMPENTNTYSSFQTQQATRLNVIYTASNDGFLHGFEAGSYATDGTYDTTTNDGKEVIAYMPETVLNKIAQNNATVFATNYNYTDPAYTHRFFVNATPGTGDLYYSNAWHTWLVGGLGGGGKALYALDITNPSSFSASSVLKELYTTEGATPSSTMSCSNNASCGLNDLGNTYGVPIIRRMHNGLWAVIFGNGYNSANGKAAIFIAIINNAGSWTTYELTTNTQSPNGINYVNSADLDADNVVDYLYAGDLFGNVWRFDVTSSDPSQWKTSTFGGASPQPIFTAVNSSGAAQPITSQIQVVKTQGGTIAQGSVPRLLLMFGTGKNLEAIDLLPNNTSYGVQSIYGIWDYDMAAWNALSSVDYSTQSAPQAISRDTSLQQQSVNGTFADASGAAFTAASTTGFRTLSKNTVCWQGVSLCSANNKLGFYLDLPALSEGVIYNPTMLDGVFVVNTTIPTTQTQGLTCTPPSPPGGWTMAINPINGGALSQSYFGTNGSFVPINGNMVGGLYSNAVGTPSEIKHNSKPYLINKTTNGTIVVTQVNPPTVKLGPGYRTSWIQLR